MSGEIQRVLEAAEAALRAAVPEGEVTRRGRTLSAEWALWDNGDATMLRIPSEAVVPILAPHGWIDWRWQVRDRRGEYTMWLQVRLRDMPGGAERSAACPRWGDTLWPAVVRGRGEGT